eukprot:12918718-Prorocentrum_lima.AAC.1
MYKSRQGTQPIQSFLKQGTTNPLQLAAATASRYDGLLKAIGTQKYSLRTGPYFQVFWSST